MAGGEGPCAYEFGPDPGAFKVWFGEHLNKRFDELPKGYRAFLAKRSESNKAPNLTRFKRLCDEYDASQAREQRNYTKRSSAVSDHVRMNTNQRTSRQQTGSKKSPGPTVSFLNSPQAKLIGEASTRATTLGYSTDQNSSRRHDDTWQDAKSEARSQLTHRTPRLKQIQLPFMRTPLGGGDANKPTSLSKPASAMPVACATGKVPRKLITSSRRSGQADSSTIVSLLSTSKGDRPRDKSLCTERPAPNTPSSQSLLGHDGPKSLTPRPTKRQKTAHQSEQVPEEASSSQSSVHSPWRPLRLVVVSEDHISV